MPQNQSKYEQIDQFLNLGSYSTPNLISNEHTPQNQEEKAENAPIRRQIAFENGQPSEIASLHPPKTQKSKSQRKKDKQQKKKEKNFNKNHFANIVKRVFTSIKTQTPNGYEARKLQLLCVRHKQITKSRQCTYEKLRQNIIHLTATRKVKGKDWIGPNFLQKLKKDYPAIEPVIRQYARWFFRERYLIHILQKHKTSELKLYCSKKTEILLCQEYFQCKEINDRELMSQE